eukprot:4325474-Alexandrium_andersonii.AAC.1
MSASLVGSEMCIRDSFPDPLCFSRGRPRPRAPPARAGAAISRGSSGGCACLLYTSDAADDM